MNPHALPPVRDPAHLAFVRSLPCSWCGRSLHTEASHHGPHGTGTKASDHRAIPLCGTTFNRNGCHADFHAGRHPLPRWLFETWAEWQAVRVLCLRLAAMHRDTAVPCRRDEPLEPWQVIEVLSARVLAVRS